MICSKSAQPTADSGNILKEEQCSFPARDCEDRVATMYDEQS
jgi:hypothetical protein